MRSAVVGLFLVLSGSVTLTSCGKASQRAGLEVTYGSNGIQRLSFSGVVLEDLAKYPADAFHIWHIKATGLHGKTLSDPQYGWGEVNKRRAWNTATHSWLYTFIWGSISVQFMQKGNTLDMAVTEKNNADSGITLDGATIYPFVLHFPEAPEGFDNPSYEHLAVKPGDPTPIAEWDQSQLSIVADPGSTPLYHGFEPAGGGNNYFPVISSTCMDSMSTAYPRFDRPVAPGASDTFTVSLRFTSSE